MSRGANIPSSESRVADEDQSAPAWNREAHLADLRLRSNIDDPAVQAKLASALAEVARFRMQDPAGFARAVIGYLRKRKAYPHRLRHGQVIASAEASRLHEYSIVRRMASAFAVLGLRWRAPESRIASLVALVATRPVHGPPAPSL